MKVKDLIDILKDYDEEAEVLLHESDYDVHKPCIGVEEDFFLNEYATYRSSYESIEQMADHNDLSVPELIDELKTVVVIY